MLHTILTDPESGYLYIRIDGKLTREDYDRFEPDFRQLAKSREQPLPIMIEISDDFSDWSGARALREETRFDSRHHDLFGRIAVVGDARVDQWAAYASSLPPGIEVRFFEHAKRANAAQWLRGEPLTQLP